MQIIVWHTPCDVLLAAKESGVRTMGLLRQLLASGSNELSYLIADPITRRTALIDPVAQNRASIERLLRGLGLELDYVIATHTHTSVWPEAQHYREMGARVAVHNASRVHERDLPLRDGDRIFVGEEVLEVIHTPGHTACSVCLRCGDRVWVGDTLFVGGIADVQGADVDLRAIYKSVLSCIYGMPDDMTLYPAHAVAGRRISTVAQERDTNRDLPAGRSLDEFVETMQIPNNYVEE